MLSEGDKTFAAARAERFWVNAQPKFKDLHVFESDQQWQAFLANGSQLFDVSKSLANELLQSDQFSQTALLARLGLVMPPQISDIAPEAPTVYALSLAIAQKCNLACTYCYAEQGSFGEKPQNMSLNTAIQAVDLLLDQAASTKRANLAFLGGEPLANRADLRACVTYAATKALRAGIDLSFSITSNGTLLTTDDAAFFEQYAFAVTISLDGLKEQHDQLRPFKSKHDNTNQKSSFEQTIARVKPLLDLQHRMQVSARVTVTPHNQNLPEVLDQFVALGFHSVGFSPMLRSPTGRDELQSHQLKALLGQMTACGEKTERMLRAGSRYPFANLMNALKEIAKGTHRPYPCGAGAGYLGVAADGKLSACHRFVNEPIAAFGSLQTGVDQQAQRTWLSQRHVHQQSPCKECWARYLCGGGCHHEVIARGRVACDYIRGWLQYCLEAYLRLGEQATQ
jgi:uncharacterized protein